MEDNSLKNLTEGADTPDTDNKAVEDSAPKAEPIFIIDETETTFVMSSETTEPVKKQKKAEKVKKEKKPKEKKVKEKKPKEKKVKEKKPKKEKTVGEKFNALQIVLICVASVVALWTAMYTVDHTLAANGVSPVFCKMTEEFEDGSASYKGLGYKVQFKFDNNGNLTQKCLPIWKDGPNDIK